MTTMPDTVVVGGGISGLCVAYGLSKAGQSVVLLEASARVGGVIQTITQQGYTLEAGPNTVSSTAKALLALCAELDLPVKPCRPQANKRYILQHGRLQPVPSGPLSLLSTPLLSPMGKCRLLSEGLVTRRPATLNGRALPEENIASWATRRLGPEVLDTLLGPFLSGIYAGNPQQLSMQATLPTLLQWEQDHGSLTMGAVQALKRRLIQPKGQAISKPSPKGLSIVSFEGGLSALPKALQQAIVQLGGNITTNTTVKAINKHLDGYQLTLAPTTGPDQPETTISAKRVVVTTSAPVAGRLLAQLAPVASQALLAIPHPHLAGVHVGLHKTAITHALDGFGCLLPRYEGLTLLGSIWASQIFENRAPEGHVLLSCFIGGALQPQVAEWSDEQCLRVVLADLQQVFNCPQPLAPAFSKVIRWPQAIAQYTVEANDSHCQRLTRIADDLAQQADGLHLVGNYLRGVSLNACVQQALQRVEKLLATDVLT
jgi:protoporphyrinogen/coproporphyrinogen III oxidase